MNKCKNLHILVAFVFTTLATCLSLCLSSFNLQNDDLQIYFLLLNGGCLDGEVGYGIFTNYLVGLFLSKLSVLFPQINGYLLFVVFLSVLSCLIVNAFVLKVILQKVRRASLYFKLMAIIEIILLFLINVVCIRCTQYTHVAIWASTCGILSLSKVCESRRWVWYSLGSMVLLCSAYGLRASTLIPSAMIMTPLIYRILKNKKGICVGVLTVVLICIMAIIDYGAYKEDHSWKEARQTMWMRQKILDSADNSGINKGCQLQAAGIDPESFALFKSFVYTPSMDSMEKISQGLAIHREGRKGLMGSKMLADMGILKAPLSARLKSSLTFFQRLTPWVPLGLMLFLWGVGYSKRGVRRVCSMVVCLAAYVSVLLLLQRMVGRVLDPVLYAAAVWMMALPTEENNVNRRKWVAAACGIIGLLGCLFFVRHWRVSPSSTPAQDYCAAHPDTLYLTTCQQGLGLYPTGFCGYSYDWLQHANILPIADGWNYYTPAYKAALASRGFSSLQEAFLHPRTLIVIREGSLKVTDTLKRLAACEWGKKIECSVVHTHAGFHFVKVEVKENF